MSALLQPEDRVLSTLNADGSRRWLDPKPVDGFFRRRRAVLAWGLIAIFVVLPHLHWDGRQLFFMNIADGEFTLFGVTFLRTDTLLLALTAVGLAVSIFLVTALFGRVWCGWACPQTVYLEFLFRPLGKLFDGKGRAGLHGAISRFPKPVLVAARWSLVAAICFLLANTFLAYFVGSRTVIAWSTQPPWLHPLGFGFVVFVTALMVGNFGFFREQLCFIACPYGRLQSVLLDKHSLIVGYDHRRGEPRGKKRRGSDRAEAGGDISLKVVGDCVDCNRCVSVCPTGIDIRDGLQLECLHCARCIDACDEVMSKLGREAGLIRYTSQAVLGGERGRFLRPRAVVYPAILAVVFTAVIALVGGHAPADVRIVRDRGQPFYTLPNGEISNQMRLRITNREREAKSFTFSPAIGGVRLEAEGAGADGTLALGPGETRSARLLLIAAPETLTGAGGAIRVPITISDGDGFETTRSCKLLGPMNTKSPGLSAAGGHERSTQ